MQKNAKKCKKMQKKCKKMQKKCKKISDNTLEAVIIVNLQNKMTLNKVLLMCRILYSILKVKLELHEFLPRMLPGSGL